MMMIAVSVSSYSYRSYWHNQKKIRKLQHLRRNELSGHVTNPIRSVMVPVFPVTCDFDPN